MIISHFHLLGFFLSIMTTDCWLPTADAWTYDALYACASMLIELCVTLANLTLLLHVNLMLFFFFFYPHLFNVSPFDLIVRFATEPM